MSAPGMPATFQPMSVSKREPGPGAAREMAKRSMNSVWVSQPWTWTTCWSMSAMMLCPPPMESSDSGAKTTISSHQLPLDIRRVPPDQQQTEGRQAEDHGDHRPAQHPDHKEGGKQDDGEARPAPEPLPRFHPHGDGEAGSGGSHAAQGLMHPGDIPDPVID